MGPASILKKFRVPLLLNNEFSINAYCVGLHPPKKGRKEKIIFNPQTWNSLSDYHAV